MTKFFQNIFFLIVSIIIGYAFYTYTNYYVIKPVDGYNQLNFSFSYLLSSNKFLLKSYDEKGKLQLDIDRNTTVGSNYSDQASKDFTEIFRHEIQAEEMSFLIPLLSSHKIELTLEGKGNLAILGFPKCNNKEIAITEFLKKLTSSQKFRIGTLDSMPDFVIIQLFEDKVTFDVTDLFNPVKLTEAQDKQFKEDYNFLMNVYLGLCILIALALVLTGYKVLTKRYYLKAQYEGKTGTSEVAKYNSLSYVYGLLLLTIVISINTSFYIILKDALLYNPGTFEENTLLFEQNYLPVILLALAPLVLCLYVKQKWLRGIISVIPLGIIVLLVVDNCLQLVLGVRYNLNFAGNFAGDIKYIGDFVVKYLIAPSGQLSIYTIIALLVAIVFFTFKTIVIPKRIAVGFSVLLVLGIIWGVKPEVDDGGGHKLANVFQINGYSFYAVGNVNKPYDETYAPRDNLDFKWEELPGQNQQKNVILLIVESWSCNLTYICGSGPSYMPKLESLAKNNLFFNNYHATLGSTSGSTLEMLKSVPVVPSLDEKNEFKKKLYQENDLVTKFKEHNYTTRFISSTDNVFGMDSTLANVKFDEVITATSKDFENIKNRYVFNSINDNELFTYISNRISQEKGKFFYVTKTASNHSPYNSPLGFNDMQSSFKYTDDAVYKFIEHLKQINYFDNGIVVLLGDHKAWIPTEGTDINTDLLSLHHMPLIIIDGKNQGKTNEVVFNHSSLGIIIQDLMFETYKKNRFNVNPLKGQEKELMYCYDFTKPNELTVQYNGHKAQIIMNGNDTTIKEEGVFTGEETNLILGYLAWFK